jgi:hypothetical protein
MRISPVRSSETRRCAASLVSSNGWWPTTATRTTAETPDRENGGTELLGQAAFHKLEHRFAIPDRLRDVLAEQRAIKRQCSRRHISEERSSRTTWGLVDQLTQFGHSHALRPTAPPPAGIGAVLVDLIEALITQPVHDLTT